MTIRIDETTGYVPGFDCSWYQDLDTTAKQVDFQLAYERGMRFCFIKASQGLKTDPDFDYNWRASAATPLLRGPYHFADYRYRAAPQAEFVCSLTGGKQRGQLPIVLDLEKLWMPRPERPNMLAWIKEWFETADELSGKPGIFYSNPDALLYWLAPLPDWLTAHPLWIAHYGVKKPTIGGFKSWKFWQYASTGDGLYYGMESKGLDMDWYNGTLADLRRWCGLDAPEPPAQPEPLTIEQRVARLENAAEREGWVL